MTVNIDLPPVYDPAIKILNEKFYFSDVYRDWLAATIQTLTTYLTQNGIFLPQLTTAQRDSIQTPIYGQMIYNTTVGSAQYWKKGSPDAWVSFP